MTIIIRSCFFCIALLTGISQAVLGGSVDIQDAQSVCPKNLSGLEESMQDILRSISNEQFKKSMETAIRSSIPEAIQIADGINRQIKFLQQEIREQNRSRSYAENVARKAVGNMDQDLEACRPGEKGSYCEAVEQYYTAMASNLANQGFLNALQCYKKHGVP